MVGNMKISNYEKYIIFYNLSYPEGTSLPESCWTLVVVVRKSSRTHFFP